MGKVLIPPRKQGLFRQSRGETVHRAVRELRQEASLEQLAEDQQPVIDPGNGKPVIEAGIAGVRAPQRAQFGKGIGTLLQFCKGMFAVRAGAVFLAGGQVHGRQGVQMDAGKEGAAEEHAACRKGDKRGEVPRYKLEKRLLAACKRIGQQGQGVSGHVLEGNTVQRAAIEQVEIGEPVLQRRGELLRRVLLCCGKEGVQIACVSAVSSRNLPRVQSMCSPFSYS